MLTKAKSNSIITHEVAGALIKFRVLDIGELVLDLSKVHAENAARALSHGFIQRVADAAAISRDTKTGKSASPRDKFEAMEELVNHYNSGSAEWRLARAEGSGFGRSYLLLALCELYPNKTRDELDTWLKAKTAEQRRGLEMEESIKAKIDAMKAKGTEHINTQVLLGELG